MFNKKQHGREGELQRKRYKAQNTRKSILKSVFKKKRWKKKQEYLCLSESILRKVSRSRKPSWCHIGTAPDGGQSGGQNYTISVKGQLFFPSLQHGLRKTCLPEWWFLG